MSHIGLATSIGGVLEIPFILRSLADSLGMYSNTRTALRIDIGIMNALATGTDIDDFGRVVDSYAFEWWGGNRPPSIHIMLGPSTLEECLSRHRLALQTRDGQPVEPLVIDPIPLIQVPSRTGPHAGSFPQSSCSSCEPHRAIASALVLHSQNLKNQISALVSTHKIHQQRDMRDAAGYFMMYQEVMQKEADNCKPFKHTPAHGPTDTAKMARSVRHAGLEEMKRLIYTPGPQDKWTWGEALSTQEVVNITRDSKRLVNYSGLFGKLPEGRHTGEWSDTNSLPTGSANFNVVSPSVMQQPPATLHEYPEHFRIDPEAFLEAPAELVGQIKNYAAMPPVSTSHTGASH